MTQWKQHVGDRVGAAIKAARGKRSAQWLSDRTIELGHRVSRETVSNIENGRKSGVDVADLMVLAAALDISPIELIFPGVPDEQTEVLPGVRTDAMTGLLWFTGESPFAPGAVGEPIDTKRLELARRRVGLNEALTRMELEISAEQNPELKMYRIEHYKNAQQQLGELTRELGAKPLFRDPPAGTDG